MKILTLFLVLLVTQVPGSVTAEVPIRLGLVGLVHDHARGFLTLLQEHKEIELVGIVESNRQLCAEYARRYL